jgi:hypothetical protein
MDERYRKGDMLPLNSKNTPKIVSGVQSDASAVVARASSWPRSRLLLATAQSGSWVNEHHAQARPG